jgi:hypothetical protein
MLSTVDGAGLLCVVWCGTVVCFEWLMMTDDGLENFAPTTNYETHLYLLIMPRTILWVQNLHRSTCSRYESLIASSFSSSLFTVQQLNKCRAVLHQ